MIEPPNKQDEAEPLRPSRCPACDGRQLVTTSKTIDRASYWRCETCGEVWNLDRCRPAYRSGRR